jgi:hypothetical protein
MPAEGTHHNRSGDPCLHAYADTTPLTLELVDIEMRLVNALHQYEHIGVG